MNTETSTPTRKANESGILGFDGSSISYTSRYYGSFSLPLSEVAVVGEWTNQDGPGIDDWFLVVVPRSGGGWFEASMYAERGDQLREELSAALGGSLGRNDAARGGDDEALLHPIPKLLSAIGHLLLCRALVASRRV